MFNECMFTAVAQSPPGWSLHLIKLSPRPPRSSLASLTQSQWLESGLNQTEPADCHGPLGWWEDWTSSSSSPSPHTSRPRLSWRTSNTTMRSLRTPSHGGTWRKLANFGSHPLDLHPHLTPSSLKGKKRNFIYWSNLTCISQADSGKNRSEALSRETSEIHKNQKHRAVGIYTSLFYP